MISKGVKYLRYVPNADHSLRGSDAYETMLACYNAVIYGKELPKFDWTLEKDGAIRVAAKDKPTSVKLWQATNPEARDFRIETLGPKWQAPLFREKMASMWEKCPSPAKDGPPFLSN